MKYILLSTRPKWCDKICHEIGKDENGKPIYEKRIEVRKTAPKEVPFKVYIYCSYGNDRENYMLGRRGKVIGEFVCNKVYLIKNQGSSFSVADEEQSVTNEIARQSCLNYYNMVSYLGNKDGYAWHISDLKIYDKPKELREFRNACPDKFRYCEICKYGSVVLSPDEEEYALYHGGNYDTYETVCHNIVTRPPQSYMYVEEIDE